MPESVSELPLVTQSAPRNSNKKALKVAGLTLLASVLVVSQCFTAYMVLDQKNQLKELDTRMERLKEISGRRTMGPGAPMRMQMPMSSMPLLKMREKPSDKKDSDKGDSRPMTLCEKQSLGLVSTQVHSFRPKCDLTGSFVPRQCWMGVCWCVEADGTTIANTLNAVTCSSGNARVAQAFAAPAMQLQTVVEKDPEAKDN